MPKLFLRDLRTELGAKSVEEVKKLCLAYKNMLRRCYDTRCQEYKNYGARGISVCTEWLNSREEFLRWALCAGHAMDLSLDRVDNGQGYSPSNCRWATMMQQQRNRRGNRLLTYQGRTQVMSAWAAELGIGTDTLHRRVNVYGMPLEKALRPGRIRGWNHGTRAGYEGHKCRCDKCKASNNARHAIQRARRKNRKLTEEKKNDQ